MATIRCEGRADGTCLARTARGAVPRCPSLVHRKAAHPLRVHVGVVWQVDPVEDAALLLPVGAAAGKSPAWLPRVREVSPWGVPGALLCAHVHPAPQPCSVRWLCLALCSACGHTTAPGQQRSWLHASPRALFTLNPAALASSGAAARRPRI